MSKKISGSCLCKKVSFEADTAESHAHACHCSMCRKWSGGPFFAMNCGKEVQFEGGFSVYDSSKWAERGFCSHCGTHLFYRLKSAQMYFIPVELFENFSEFHFAAQLYTDQKPEYYSFSNETAMLTEQQVMESFQEN